MADSMPLHDALLTLWSWFLPPEGGPSCALPVSGHPPNHAIVFSFSDVVTDSLIVLNSESFLWHIPLEICYRFLSPPQGLNQDDVWVVGLSLSEIYQMSIGNCLILGNSLTSPHFVKPSWSHWSRTHCQWRHPWSDSGVGITFCLRQARLLQLPCLLFNQ